jgi:hypothetical protein
MKKQSVATKPTQVFQISHAIVKPKLLQNKLKMHHLLM